MLQLILQSTTTQKNGGAVDVPSSVPLLPSPSAPEECSVWLLSSPQRLFWNPSLQSHQMPSRKLGVDQLGPRPWVQALQRTWINSLATISLIWEEKLQINIHTFVCPRLPRSQSGSFSIYNRHVNYDLKKKNSPNFHFKTKNKEREETKHLTGHQLTSPKYLKYRGDPQR